MNVEELRRALHDEATLEPVDVDQAVAAVLRRGRRHRLRRRLAVGVVTAGLVVSGVVLLRQDRPSDEVVTAPPPADIAIAALTTEPVDAASGLYASEIVYVDAVTGGVHRESLPVDNYGDYPVQLLQIGDRLLLPGGGVVRSAPLDLSSAPEDLAPALVFVASARRDRVWTVSDWQVGNTGPYTLTEVDVNGAPTTGPVVAPAEANWPIIGIDRGVLMYAPGDQALLWEPDTGEIVRRIDGVQPFQGNGWGAGDLFAWVGPCSGQPRCDTLHVLDLESGAERTIDPPLEATGFVPDGAISPDGETLALFVTSGDAQQLALVDLDTGDTQTVAGSEGGGSGVTWAPDGSTVYFGQDDSTTVSGYRIGEASSERIQEGLAPFTALLAVDTSTVALGADAGAATADVPDVRGLSVDAARSLLEDAGFALSITDGDPTADDATVSAQEPPGGTPVPYASTVGVRTALVSDGVCAGLDVLPERTGDAVQLAQEASFTDAIQAAAQAAREPLLTAIEAVLAEMQAGRDLSTAGLEVARALDTIAIHRDACATR